MTDLFASQLFHLTDIVKANSAIRGSNLEDTFTVTLKLSEDGFGIVQGVPSPRTKTKFKKKIFRANIVIMNVKCSQGKLVYKCAAPNFSDHPTVLNAFTDENDNWSMSVSAQVLNFYRDLLLQDRNVIQVNGLKFRFVFWTCRDGKWLSRSLGHAGQASDYHCNRCLVNSDQTHLAAEPRTTEVHNSLAVYCTAINPDRLVREELFT